MAGFFLQVNAAHLNLIEGYIALMKPKLWLSLLKIFSHEKTNYFLRGGIFIFLQQSK